MAIKAVEIFLKHSEEYTPQAADTNSQVRLACRLAGIHLRANRRRVKKDQRNQFSFDHYLVERNGDGGTHPASPGSALARPEKSSASLSAFKRRGREAPSSGSCDQGPSERGEDVRSSPSRYAPRSPPSNNTAITPIRLRCWNGFELSRTQPRLTYLVYGEPSASSQLRDLMKKELGWNVQVAEYRERVDVS